MYGFIRPFWKRHITCLLLLTVGLLSLVPQVEAGFVPTAQSHSAPTHRSDMAVVQKALEYKLVQTRLRDLGYRPEEIADRLQQLSDAEIHALAERIDNLVPAGDSGFGIVIALLVAIILVILVIKVTGSKVIIG